MLCVVVSIFSNFFLSDFVRIWNSRNTQIFSILKYEISKIKWSQIYQLPSKPAQNFMIGKRYNQTSHTQIRLTISSLFFCLYLVYQRHCINSSRCYCGDTPQTTDHCLYHVYQRHCINSSHCYCGETTDHYFFLCPQFSNKHNVLFF